MTAAMRVIATLKARGVVTVAQGRPSKSGSAAIFRTPIAMVGGSVLVFGEHELETFDRFVAEFGEYSDGPLADTHATLVASRAARTVVIWEGANDTIDREIRAAVEDLERGALQ